MMNGKMKPADGGAPQKAMKQVAKKEVMAHESKMHGKKMANGGMAGGCGYRAAQDYGKK